MIDRQTFNKLLKEYDAVPLSMSFPAGALTPLAAFLALRRAGAASFLFESGERPGRYSYIGIDPVITIRAADGNLRLSAAPGYGALIEGVTAGGLFDTLSVLLKSITLAPVAGMPGLTCGLVGHIGYDAVREIERLPNVASPVPDAPDSVLGLFTTVVAFDQVAGTVSVIRTVFRKRGADSAYDRALAEISSVKETLLSPGGVRSGVCEPFRTLAKSMVPVTPGWDYAGGVRQALNHIDEGDIFQVVISQGFTLPFSGDPFSLYRSLRTVNPSPYMFYIDAATHVLLGSSPEMLVRKTGSVVETVPIAGTRPRGVSDEEDLALERELIDDEKERAEHLMLVDLGRNDVGKVSQIGSVKTERFMDVERYSHVMHLTSRVSGTIIPGRTAVDAFRAVFPAGTVTGAPKIRAMQIIEELEETHRGYYGGGVGYFDLSGNMDFCIAIRAVLAEGSDLHIRAGAGIVAGSHPEREYAEVLNKIAAIAEAARIAGEIAQ